MKHHRLSAVRLVTCCSIVAAHTNFEFGEAAQAFPRFYFMSSADLLDVLSNGNNPARVVHHFPKFFNAIVAQLQKTISGTPKISS